MDIGIIGLWMHAGLPYTGMQKQRDIYYYIHIYEYTSKYIMKYVMPCAVVLSHGLNPSS